MDQGRKCLKTKQSLGEKEISDLFSDELSEVPSDIFSNSDIAIIILMGQVKKDTKRLLVNRSRFGKPNFR
jgi:hypothetical protein